MKQLKRMVLILMCTGTMLGMTACGSNDADDNAANNNAATDNNGNAANNGTNNGSDTNGATDGTDRNGNDNIAVEIGVDIRDGVDDMGDALDGEDNDVNRDNNNDKVRD